MVSPTRTTNTPAPTPDPRDLTLLGRLRYWILNAQITQQFGPSSLPGEPSYMGFANFHKGVDLVGPRGDTVYSPASGRVVGAGQLPGWAGANVVKILAPNGFLYTLAHFASINVRQGDLIRAGESVGVQGSTGYSTAEHTHLEVTAPNGQAVNLGTNTKQVFWTLAHGLGFGLGYSPVGYPAGVGDNTPPSPTANPLPVLAGLIRGLKYQPAQYQEPTDTGQKDTGTGRTPGDICGPAPAITDPAKLANWLSCMVAETANGAAAGTIDKLDVGTQVSSFFSTHLAEFAVGGLGLILLFAGLRSLTNEPPVQVVTQPIKDATGAAASTVGAVATRGASVAGKVGARRAARGAASASKKGASA